MSTDHENAPDFETTKRAMQIGQDVTTRMLLGRIDAMYVGGHPLRGHSKERRLGWDEAIATVRAALEGVTTP